MPQTSTYVINEVPVGAMLAAFNGGSFKLTIASWMAPGLYKIKLSRDGVPTSKNFTVT